MNSFLPEQADTGPAADASGSFEPRKTPVQARAAVTVDAISEATIQILLSHGADRLTTTRVAARAGVSVGTLYQYYPNKQSLLFAVLEGHLDKVSGAVEAACAHARHQPLSEMVREVVGGFVDAKMERPAISRALYQIAADVGGPVLVKRSGQRSRKALEAMLKTAPDTVFPPDRFAVETMFSAMTGATRSVLEAGASPAMVQKLRHHLVLLCQSYMDAVAKQPRVGDCTDL
jgi:AcrR family transcriptional regulator